MAESVLGTADQDVLEACAIEILSSQPMRQRIRACEQSLLADPRAAVPDARRAVPRDAEELAMAVALIAANTDAARPKVVWVYSAPRAWRGRKVPGSRWGIDNPDNIYRIVAVDDESSYELVVRPHIAAPVQYSFLLYDHFVAEDGHLAHVDAPIGGYRDCDLQKEADGSFRLTIDPEPANGRANHIQSKPGARQLLIRNTLSDWEAENPLAIRVTRTGGPPVAAPPSHDVLVGRAAHLLDAITELVLKWKSQLLFGKWAANAICDPYGRGRSWGFAATGDFKLGADQALVITAHPLEGKYFSIHLTDLWLASLEHVERSCSFNAGQAAPNPDGTYTFVVSAVDPGVHNWLDTCGLAEGGIMLRWQQLPESRGSAEGAVREVALVERSELERRWPQLRRIGAAERTAMLSRRAAAYAHRYLPS
jgi:hypothetical protein